MATNASQPLFVATESSVLPPRWLLDRFTITSLVLTCVIAIFILPKFIALVQNATSPICSIPGPLINKLSSWPLTISTIKGTSHHFARALHEKYGPVVVLAPKMIAVSDPKEIDRIIRAEDWTKSHAIYGNFRQDPERPTLLAYTDKQAYSKRKRMLSSMFGIKYIRSMEPLMKECVKVAIKELGRACDDAPSGATAVDMQHLIHALAIDIIGITTFGESFHVVENGTHPLPLRLKQGLKIAGLMQLIPWIRKVPFLPTRDPYIDSFTYNIVNKRRNQLDSVCSQDMLQKLVTASNDAPGSDFRTSDVQDESVVMLTAGSETTANAELFTLIMLLKHPVAMKRLVEEVDHWYPPEESDRETDCSYSQTGMTYLQACIDETMRLVPGQATGSPRETAKDEIILSYRVPTGTTVFPNTQEGQMQEFWDQPQKFMPERWLDIYAAGHTNSAPFWPFSSGSRVCIGKHFAFQEMHLTLVTLLRNFTFEYIPGQDESTVFRVAQQLRSESYRMKVNRRLT